MNKIEIKSENLTKDTKFYSARTIGGATFLGGPLAAGYMIGKNFTAIGKPDQARNSLIIGFVSTLLLFTGIYLTPEDIIDKIPGQLIPLAYTGIIWGIVEWKQGAILKIHKAKGNSFFSGWKAAGVGFISLILILIGIFALAFFDLNN
ncbi:hypothetical protein ACW6QP_14225 [Salegentibacter sp. HM20]